MKEESAFDSKGSEVLLETIGEWLHSKLSEEKLKGSCKRLPRRQMNGEKNFSTRQQASTRTDAERLEEEAEGRLQSNPSMTRS